MAVSFLTSGGSGFYPSTATPTACPYETATPSTMATPPPDDLQAVLSQSEQDLQAETGFNASVNQPAQVSTFAPYAVSPTPYVTAPYSYSPYGTVPTYPVPMGTTVTPSTTLVQPNTTGAPFLTTKSGG
jgi:hypothetical protein